MRKRDVLRLPDDLEGNLRALLQTPPAPAGTAGSRKVPPKPKPTPKDKRRKLTMAMSRRRTELEREAAEHSAELARVLKDGQKPKRKRRSPKPPKVAGSHLYEMAPVRSTSVKRKAKKR